MRKIVDRDGVIEKGYIYKISDFLNRLVVLIKMIK